MVKKWCALVAGALALVGLSAGTGYAGARYLAQGTNVVTRTVSLANRGGGPALSLAAKRGPALSVNSTAQVPNLNASLLDGRTAGSLVSEALARAPRFGTVFVTATFGGRGGTYGSGGQVQCPEGTHVVSGGGYGRYDDKLTTATSWQVGPYLQDSVPYKNGWGVWVAQSTADGKWDGTGRVVAICSEAPYYGQVAPGPAAAKGPARLTTDGAGGSLGRRGELHQP